MPKCPRCGNEDFTGIDTSKPYDCPIPGCGMKNIVIRTSLGPGMGWLLQQQNPDRSAAPRQEDGHD